ncbi:MAG: signal peptidase I [Micrococcaceae bacterium]
MSTQQQTRPSAPSHSPRTRGIIRRGVSLLATFAVVALLALTGAVLTGLLSLHVVTSSSMQPTLRVHDVLITRAVPADQVVRGDIATLIHPDGYRVTHRVLTNTEDPNGSGRLITMQGDDNDAADPQPYPVDEVEVNVLRVPWAGAVLQTLTTPPMSYVALGSLALVVVASLLPRRTRDHADTEVVEND